MRNHIIENILTLRCPNGHVWVDYDGCNAVQCHCSVHFCGLCQQRFDTSRAVHQHCNSEHGGYYADYRSHHKRRRENAIVEYLKNAPQLQMLVLGAMQRDLADLRIDVHELTERLAGRRREQQVRPPEYAIGLVWPVALIIFFLWMLARHASGCFSWVNGLPINPLSFFRSPSDGLSARYCNVFSGR